MQSKYFLETIACKHFLVQLVLSTNTARLFEMYLLTLCRNIKEVENAPIFEIEKRVVNFPDSSKSKQCVQEAKQTFENFNRIFPTVIGQIVVCYLF